MASAREHNVDRVGVVEHGHNLKEGLPLMPFTWPTWKPARPVRDYLELITSARTLGWTVLAGLEMDYFPGCEVQMKAFLKDVPLDYVIGSVHWIDDFGVDVPEHQDRWSSETCEPIYRAYFERVIKMVNSRCFDILGHADLVKLWGYRPAADISDLYERLVTALKYSGMAVEINTGGLRRPVKEVYPGPDFIQMLVVENIPMVLSSDAHEPGDVGFGFAGALQTLKDLGIRSTEIEELGIRRRLR
jgi:histidinol-phosphatase (PHP family)